ncbi:MAG: hypothetical protein WC609_02810 [Candidatus Paceibacterota bacterium]|jgi:hypothetical protein
MVLRNLVSWIVPLSRFQDFYHGEEVADMVPVIWELSWGDTLQWEVGGCLTGLAVVVSCEEEIEIVEDKKDGTEILKHPMVGVVFRRIS